jgi:hypothetical protein
VTYLVDSHFVIMYVRSITQIDLLLIIKQKWCAIKVKWRSKKCIWTLNNNFSLWSNVILIWLHVWNIFENLLIRKTFNFSVQIFSLISKNNLSSLTLNSVCISNNERFLSVKSFLHEFNFSLLLSVWLNSGFKLSC